MKTLPFLLATILLGAVAWAEPLKQQHVAADAKWIVHLDVENLLSTQLGEFVAREIFDKEFRKPMADLRNQFDLDLDWRDIESVTAYGSDFKQLAKGRGVLLVRSRFDVGESVDAVIEKLNLQLGEDRVPVQRIQDEPYAVYTVKSNLFGAAMARNLFVLSRSQAQLEKACDVINGKAEAVTTSGAFPTLAQAKGFLVAAVADAFQKALKLPPPAAQGLKNAEGGQVVAGEKADRVYLNMALNTRDTESATQMQQVFQGLIAMAALSQGENPDVQKLVQAARVSGSEKTVNVSLEMPASDVIARVAERHNKRKK